MDLQVKFSNDHFKAKLPKRFMNHLLAEGHNFEEILIIEITNLEGNKFYLSMSEFTNSMNTIILPSKLKHFTKEYSFIHVNYVPHITADMIYIQPFTDIFASIANIKEKLELYLTKNVCVVGRGQEIIIENETIVVTKLTKDSIELDYSSVVNCEMKVEFLESKETYHRKNGYLLGGKETSREKWLSRFS